MGRLLIALCALVMGTHPSTSSPTKNVLVFIGDDMGFEMGAYNNSVIKTPNLDQLAKRGVLFKSARTSVSSCSPSRSAILTGLPQHQNGMYGLHHPPHSFNTMDTIHSVSGILKSHGIKTGIIGKKHVGPDSVYPFDFSYTEEHYPLLQVGRNITRMKDLAQEFFQETDKPFFLYIGFHDPHRCAANSGGYGLFCENFGSGKPGTGPVIQDWSPHWYRPEDVVVPAYLPDNPDTRMDIAKQYTSIDRMDQGVGLIMNELQKAGHADDTLVIFTSDNGIPFPGAKTNLYNPGMGEPMIVSSPSHKERWGQESDAMVSLLDIVPTVLDWFHVPYPNYKVLGHRTTLTGQSLLPVMEREPTSGYDHVFASHDFHEVTMYYPMRVVEIRDYKLIHNLNYNMPYGIATDLAVSPTFTAILRNASLHRPINWIRTLHDYYHRDQWQLFVKADDPLEIRNVAGDQRFSSVVQDLKSRLYSWQNETADFWICEPRGVLIGEFKPDNSCHDMYNV